MKLKNLTFAALLSTSIITYSVYADNIDPYESTNRSISEFNHSFDAIIPKPIAETYVEVTPNPIQIAAHNFVGNIFEPETILNDLLQGKLTYAVQDTARFLFNTTFGLFGLIDIATPMGLPKRNEDLGQTFAVWGWGTSSYVELPLLGPSTVRDTTAKPIQFLYLLSYGWPVTLLKFLDVRASVLPLEPMIDASSDRYLFLRDSYLQHRQFLINDGMSSNNNKFDDFDFSDDDE